MSGRSAYVRKKITETKTADKKSGLAVRGPHTLSDPLASRGSEYGDGSLPDFPGLPETGYGTTHGRSFNDSSLVQADLHHRGPPTVISTYSSGSQSGASEGGRRHGDGYHQRPMDNFAYARVRKPTIQTEDVSGIERSGFRNALDKKSEDIRKGLGKAFGFGKKSRSVADAEPRAQSSAGMSRMGDFGEQEHDGMPSMPAVKQTQPLTWENDKTLSSPPRGQLPPIPSPANSPTIKRWVGAGRPVQKWSKLRKDPELWDPNGDVLVYLARRGQSPRPHPSFRLSSHIIEATESGVLLQLMREGLTEDDIHMPPSPAGPPPFSHHGHSSPHGYSHYGRAHPTPPASEDASVAEVDGQISYEMYFPTPPELTKSEAHRHVITTRNVFALLYHASLVGISLYQALTDLYTRLEVYMPSEADNIGTILNYLSARAIDDCRNEPETAVSLLAWSESQPIRWEEGWREAFLHSVGMYGRLNKCADYKHVTPISRALLERACLETQLRVQSAEERLTGFSYGDIWPGAGPIANSPARAAADRLQKFLISHFAAECGEWPPSPSEERSADGEDTWLTRAVARKLQRDFGALYDYLVNRDISWDESEARVGRKWIMVSQSGNKAFDADTPDLPITDLLIEWDIRSKFPHIPHPYPLVPDSIPTANIQNGSRDKPRKSEKDKTRATEDRALERRVHLAYTEATNIYALGSDFVQSELVDSFVKFEKSDQIGLVDPMAARRGRWVLIYGILQTLATVSVDAPHVRYKDNVAYHLSPRLKGTKIPPWRGAVGPSSEASHVLSYCWVTPRSWDTAQDDEASDEISPITKMMRAQGHNFPHPPPSANALRSALSGWHTPMSRSVRSSAWGSSSVVSTTSDDARSIGTSATSMYRARSREGVKGPGKSGTPISPVGRDWPVRGQSIRNARSSEVAAMSVKPLPPLKINATVTGGGGFLDLEDESPPRARSRAEHGGRSRTPRDGDSIMDMVIRDFDELDVIDDHDP